MTTVSQEPGTVRAGDSRRARRRAGNTAIATASVLAAILSLGAAATWVVHAADGKPADGAKSAAPKAALTVTVTRPKDQGIQRVVSASGNVAAWQEAIVGAESNGFRLAEVRVNVGDRVRRGQVLATFTAAMAEAELAQGRATVAEAEAALSEAAANAKRARDLEPTGALSAQQINQYLTAERTAQARLDALRASSEMQRLRLDQTVVTAPDDGVISARSATVGAVVPAGMELFRLIRQSRLEWRAEVAAADLTLIRPGMTVRVMAAGTTPISGKVRVVAPTVDAATRNGLVYVDLTGAGSARAGMFARGEFELGSSTVLTLPQSAVLLRDGFAYVFRVGADSRVARVKVDVGRRAGDRIEITGGLDATVRVVASGAGFLAEGDTVRVVDAPAAAAVAARKPASDKPGS